MGISDSLISLIKREKEREEGAREGALARQSRESVDMGVGLFQRLELRK